MPPRYSLFLIEGRHMARNWKREWIPRAIENVRTLWRKRYKDKVPVGRVHKETR